MKMKKISCTLICVLMLIAVAVFAAGCGAKKADVKQKTLLDSIKEKGVMTIGTSPDYPPFEFIGKDGKVAGLDMDLINAISKEMGVNVQLSQMGFDSIIGAVKSGQVDIGVSGFTVTPARQKSVDFTDPYFSGGQVIIAKKDSPITGAADLKGKIVGVQGGTTGEEAANKVGAGTVKTYQDFLVAIQELKSGNIDAVIGDQSVAKNVVAQQPEFVVKGTPLNAEETAIIVKKGNAELVTALNDAIKKVKQSGDYDKILAKWANYKAK